MAARVVEGRGSIHLAAFALCFALQWIHLCYAGDNTVNECFTDEQSKSKGEGHVTLTCPAQQKIEVDEALLGKSRYGICELTGEDCLVQTSLFHTSCNGVTNCTKTFKTYSPECSGNVTTLLLSYWCRPILGQTTAPPANDATPRQDVTTTPFVPPTAKPTLKPYSGPHFNHNVKEKEEEDGEDVGLVVGCALAAVVTIIMLIIAITMVIRALLQYHKKGKDGQPPGRIVSCMDSVCLQVDRLPCFSSSTDTHTDRQAKSLQEGDGSTRSTRRFNAKSETVTDPSAKYSIDRMAPVGQECSSTSSLDSGLSEMQNSSNLSSPRSHHHQHHHHQQQPKENQPSQQQQQVSTSDNRGDPCHHHLPPSSPENSTNRNSAKRSSKNSSHQTKNCPDKVSTWRQKEMTGAILAGQKDNNQNISDKSEAEQAKNVSQKRPKFDAVAIPNTESGTLC